jgi:hypothetical protein
MRRSDKAIRIDSNDILSAMPRTGDDASASSGKERTEAPKRQYVSFLDYSSVVEENPVRAPVTCAGKCTTRGFDVIEGVGGLLKQSTEYGGLKQPSRILRVR